MHQQLWGYKVEWKNVSRGTGGKKVEYHWCRRHTDIHQDMLLLQFSHPFSVSLFLFYILSGLLRGHHRKDWTNPEICKGLKLLLRS